MKRKTFNNVSVAAGKVKNSFSGAETAVNEFRKFVKNMRSENEVNIAETVFDSFGNIFLLHHAAAKGDNHVRLCCFIFFECADVSENTVLCMFPNGAGVIKNKVGFFNTVRQFVTERTENAFDFFAVGDVSLTAVSMHKSFRCALRKAGRKHNRNKLCIFFLLFKFLFGNSEISFVIQYFSPPWESFEFLLRIFLQRQEVFLFCD